MPLLRRAALSAGLALLSGVPLAAQSRAPGAPSAAAVRAAVETITETDFRARLGVIADDSMRGRDTPSRGLELTAAYVADAFRQFGLRPGGDEGTYIQRYRILRTQLDSGGYLSASVPGGSTRWVLGRDLVLQGGALPDSLVGAPVVVMHGLAADSVRPFGDVSVRGAVIFQLLPLAAQRQQAQMLSAVTKGAAAGARAWVFVFAIPAAFWARIATGANAPQYAVPGLPGLLPVPLLIMRDSSAAEMLRPAGETLAALADTSIHAVRPLRGVSVTLAARRRTLSETSAPNVVGILEGSDPRLRDEVVVVTGHMDHVGVSADGRCAAAGADSICNGADDDGSGTIGVVELAQAFSRLTPRPRRTVVFVTVSGEERGLWGSAWYVAHPVRPLAQHVAELNLDMISRNWRDSIAVLGKEMSTLGEVANRVTGEHPELGMRLVDDPEHNRYFMQSDHYSFAQQGVPVLFFFSGVHPELHQPTDDMSRIDADKAARVLRMVFHVALDVANAAGRPQWDPAARARLVESGH